MEKQWRMGERKPLILWSDGEALEDGRVESQKECVAISGPDCTVNSWPLLLGKFTASHLGKAQYNPLSFCGQL